MGFTRSPASTTNISDLPTKPTISGIQLQALFDKYSADDVPIIDNLMAELEALTAGSDIGTNAPSITAANVTDALEENRLLINTNTTADGQNVKLTGNQTIAGVKTFSSNVVVPTTPTLSTHATSKNYVDSQSPLTIPNDSIQNVKMASDVKIGSLATLLTSIKTSVVSAINELYAIVFNAQDRARVTNTINQSIPDNAFTAISFDTVRWDNKVIYSGANPTRLTAKSDGLYDIIGQARFAANAAGVRALGIGLNGSLSFLCEDVESSPSGSFRLDLLVSTQYFLSAGDYVELYAYQTSGAGLNVEKAPNYSPDFMMSKKVQV